jgi:hypothetical protein
MLNVLRVFLHPDTVGGPNFKSELDFVEGTAFLIAAVGLIHFDVKSRSFAIFLSTISLGVTAASLASLRGVGTLLWTAVWLLVLWWLLSTPARTEVAATVEQSRTA